MNERIKTLAEQAGISLSQKDFSYYWVESAEDIEKFAELIVRECVKIADNHYDTKSAIHDIKEHFGVE
jgi:chloramphenicol O-acetyltransferase